MPRFFILASCILAYLHAGATWGANHPQDGTLIIYERYPGTPYPTSITFSLPSNSDGTTNDLPNAAYPLAAPVDTLITDILADWEIVGQPPKGTITPFVGQTVTYTPVNYNDQNDTFSWRARNTRTGMTELYTAHITTTPINNPPEIQPIPGNALSFNENQQIVGTVKIFDPDSSPNLPSNLLRLDVNGTAGLLFDANLSTTSGDNTFYTIWYTPSSTPNFEALPTTYSIDLCPRDFDASGNVVNQPSPLTIQVTLTDVPEAPFIVSTENPIARTISEDEDTSSILGFTPMEIAAYDPESASNPTNKVYWSYSSNNPVIAGVVKLNGSVLAAGATSSPFDSGSLVTVDYVPGANTYGTEVLTFNARDAVGSSSASLPITMIVNAVDTDSISLNQPSPISISFNEEGAGSVLDLNPTDPDSDPDPANRPDNNSSSNPGAKIYYSLSGADAALFDVSSLGQLGFKSPPNYENPMDTGGVTGDNVYELSVQVRDNQVLPYTSDTQNLIVTVTPVNELPTMKGGLLTHDISVTEDVTWSWNAGLIDLNASDVDAGHQNALVWRIKSGSGGNFGTSSATGTGPIPSALSYTPDLDYAGDGNFSNPDDTFIVEVFDGVGVTEVTIRVFITAASDPPRVTAISPVPLESISVTRDRYTINLNENTPSTVRVEFTEVDGNGIGNFEILNESMDKVKFTGSPYWSNGATFADLNFSSLHLPDFEDNKSSDGDGNYSLVVRISDNESPTPKYQNVYLDFIIQNVDEAPAFAPEVDFNQTAMENQTHAASLTAIDPEGVSSFYWDIIFGYDSPKFQLSSSSGPSVNLSFIVPPNFENPLDDPAFGDKNNTYTVRIRVSDAPSGGKSITQTFKISVADANDFPTLIPTPLNIDEPLRTNAMMVLGQYAYDEDNQTGSGSDTLSWIELSGDTTSFALDQNGTLRFNQDSDFETDSNFTIEVRVLDGRGGFADANFSVEVNAQNEAPEFFENNVSSTRISYVQFNLQEDTSISGQISDYARDPETGNAVGLTFSENFIDYNATNDLNGTLILNTLSGQFTFTPRPNYSGLTYVDFTVSDGLMSGVLPVVFSVSEVPDASVVRESNNTIPISGLTSKAIFEGNSTFRIDLNATDPYDIPPSTTFIWSLQGDDAAKFKIEPNPGSYVSLSFLQTPDFESPHDSNLDNRYDFNFTVTDGGNSAVSYPVQITVQDGAEPPYFDYAAGWDGNTSFSHVGSKTLFKQAADWPESTMGVVFDVNASDLDGSSIIYGLTDPSTTGRSYDNNKFTINSVTGQVSFATPPDFENANNQAMYIPRDHSTFTSGSPLTPTQLNTTYVIEVNATDDSAGTDKIRHFVYLTITNIVEPPTFIDGATRNVDWNETTSTGFDANRTSTQDTNTNLILEISGGADQGLFNLNVASGILSFLTPPDFENPGSADSDNTYEVQLRIAGTGTIQDLNVTVREENDAPVVTSANLTQLTVKENQSFIIDLSVSDQDSGLEYKDILYTLNSNSTRYVAHTGVDSSVAAFYPASGSGMVDNNLPGATFAVAGDFDKDGDQDVIAFENLIHNVHFLENNASGPGVFSRKSEPDFNAVISGQPDHAVATDLDQDGDLDVVVSFFSSGEIGWFENNASGIGIGNFGALATLVTTGPTSGTDYFALGDVDGDSYPDLLIALRSEDKVTWYKNDGSINPSFSLGGEVIGPSNGLDAPRSIELVDLDNSGTLDVLISANNFLHLASNQGKGVYGVTTFTQSVLANIVGSCLLTRSADLTSDGLIDVVYATSAGAPFVLVQNAAGFNGPVSLPTHPVNPVAFSTDVAIIPATSNTRVTLAVADSSIQYISLFEAMPSLDGQFAQPTQINVGTGVSSLSLVDLNRKPDALSYSFIGGEDMLDFNESRFKNDGRLFLNQLPDFENPTDASLVNRYDVIVKVTDGQGGSTVKSVAVSVTEYNEAPYFIWASSDVTATYGQAVAWNSSPDWYARTVGTTAGIRGMSEYSVIYEHNETNLTTLFRLGAGNDENKSQTLTYSVWGGADQSKFQVDPTSGRLTFVNAPDYEANASAAGNNAYNVIVRVTDDGQPSAYDEQNITINVVDGYEPALFDPTFVTTYTIDEDTSLSPFDVNLSAIDQNLNGGITAYGIQVNGSNGTASVTGNRFDYIPDGNFTGTDVVVVEVNNTVGLTTTQNITITVNPINDAPVFKPPFVLNHIENKQDIATLSAQDDGNILFWSWTDPTVIEDTYLQLDKLTGELRFRISSGPDFDANQTKTLVREIRVTDSEGNFTDANFTINVINLNDNPPLSPYLLANASSTFTLQENNNIIVDLNASDLDNSFAPGFNNVLYSITGGADQARFTVSAQGRLSMLPAADFEYPDSANFDHIYQFTLTLSDGLVGGYSRDYPMVVTITDADENAPSITSNGGGADANFTHPENQLLVTQIKATDVETDVFTYSIWGGADETLFEINGTTGHLYFKTGANFEKPSDSDLNKLYEVWVRVSDGYSTDDQKLNIRIRDENEIPTVSPGKLSTSEDTPIIVTFTVSDPEGQISDASLLTPPANGNTSWSAFPLTTESDVKFTYTPDPNFNGTDFMVLRVSDGTVQGDVTIPIEINASADPPTANPDVFIYDDPTVDSILLDVLANDNSLPDSNTSDTLTFPKDAWTSPQYGTFGSSVTGGIVPYYIPAKDFIGIDTFQYTIIDTNDSLESTATVTVIMKRAAKFPSWRFSDKIGYYNFTTTNWIYHTDLGWLYLQDKGGLETTTWIWSDKVGWFWTGEAHVPNVYLNDLSGWFAFTVREAVGQTRKQYLTWPIYDQTTKKWMTEADLKIDRVNTVLARFESLDKVISFVLDSSLFTPAEKNAIKTELLFSGSSKTMESMGFTLGK